MSLERRALLKAYGAEVHLTPAAAVMRGAVGEGQRDSAARTHALSCPSNSTTRTTWKRTAAPRAGDPGATGDAVMHAFVHGVGTGGTITGVGQVIRERFPGVRVVAVEPEKSAVLSGGPAGEAPHRRHRRRGLSGDPGSLGDHRRAHHLRAGRPAHKAGAGSTGRTAGRDLRRGIGQDCSGRGPRTGRARPWSPSSATQASVISARTRTSNERPRRLIIGAGGLGCPAALAAAAGGVRRIGSSTTIWSMPATAPPDPARHGRRRENPRWPRWRRPCVGVFPMSR